MSSEFRILKKVGVPQRSFSEFSFKKNRIKIRQILKKIVGGFLRVIFRLSIHITLRVNTLHEAFYHYYQNQWKIGFLVRRLIKFNGSLSIEFSILWSHILGKVRPHIIVNKLICHFSWSLAYMSTPGGAKGIRHPVYT